MAGQGHRTFSAVEAGEIRALLDPFAEGSECRTVSTRIVGSEPRDQAEFIEAFTIARNYYTHYNPKLESKAARGAALFLLFIQVQAIIEMSLLRELGFGCRSIDAILERVQRYAQIDHVKATVAKEET